MKTVRKIHLWFAVPFGLVMSLICITGLILLFEPEHADGGRRPEFFLDVMRLHRWLFDAPAARGAMSAGKLIVGLSTCCMVVVLVTGIVLWWAKARLGLRRSLKISFGKGFKVFCATMHSAGGMYVVVFLLVMALTGLTWSFGWYREGFNALFAIEKGSHVVYMVHTGGFGGLVTEAVWFLAALVGFALPPTGYCLWISRLVSRSHAAGKGKNAKKG